MFGLFKSSKVAEKVRVDPTPAIDAFLSKHQMVNALPENTTRIIRMTNDPNCNINTLLDVISKDAALAGRIMKAVNSAYYALETKITRLDRAVAFMGMKAVKEVALSASLGTMCKAVKFGKYDARNLWDHSMGVAILARELSIKSQRGDSEEMFLAGMLHDLALLLACQSEVAKATDMFTRADEDQDSPFEEYEYQVFGFSHAQLGERLAASWRFPEHLQAAIRWHHEPTEAPEAHRATCNLLYIADTLCCEAKVGIPLTCNSQKLTDDQLEEANISREVATGLCERLPLLLRLYLS